MATLKQMFDPVRALPLLKIGLLAGVVLGGWIFWDEFSRIRVNRSISKSETAIAFAAIVSTAALLGGAMAMFVNAALVMAGRESEGVRRILLAIFIAGAVVAPVAVYFADRPYRLDGDALALLAVKVSGARLLIAVSALGIAAVVRWISDGFGHRP